MDLRQLEMFRAIVDTGSFTRAGENLLVSQSAISRQIKLLEEELGDRVFKRVHKKVYLTDTGKLLLRHTRRIFDELNLLHSEITDLTSLRKGTLKIAGGMSVCTYLFPNLLKRYHEAYPRIVLTVVTGTNDEILRALRANEVDLALLSLPFHDEDLEVVPGLTEELVLVTEKDHPLARKHQVTLANLEPYPFINFEKGSNTRRLIDQIFREEGVGVKTIMELQNVEITKPLVENGLGVSFVPRSAVTGVFGRNSLKVRRIEGRRLYRELGWVFLRSSYKSRTKKELLALFETMRDKFDSAPSFPRPAL